MIPDSIALKPSVLSLAAIPEHELLSPIAAGAYGQVWLARNRLGVYRAVKIVHRASFDHDRPFEREFTGIKAFEPISRSHEGLVDLLQVGRDDDAGYFYYVMELADDANGATLDPSSIDSYTPRTLAWEVKSRGRLPLDECIRIGLSLAEALAYLHGQGLVHRDIKPSNIIFVGSVPKLADVGLVTAVADARSFVGTEGFIAPEGPGTPQADLYSLGIVLYVMSTGKSHQDFPEPPAERSTETNHAQWLEFDAVIYKACQATVRERYPSASDMCAELTLIQRGQSVRDKRAARRRWAMAKILALIVAGIALLFVPISLIKRAKHGYTPNPEADRLYKLGQWYYSQLTPEAHAKALEYLSNAAWADPKFVQPYGEWMMLYAWNSVPDSSTEERRLQHVRELASKALAIDPNAAEGHAALSWCKFLQRDWHGAEDEIRRAIQLNPDLPMTHIVYCFYLSMEGRTEEARREGHWAAALEPPGSERVAAIVASWPYVAERRFDLAIAQLQRVLELDRNFAWGHSYLADCYEAQSNYVAAIEESRTNARLLGKDSARVAASHDALRRAYDERGEAGYLRKWIELLHEDEALPEEQRLFDNNIVGYYARLGEKEMALKTLEEHFNEPQTWHQIKFLAMYDSLHDEPRYKALVKRAGLEP